MQQDEWIAARVSLFDDYFICEVADPFNLYSEVAFCESALYRRKLEGLTALPTVNGYSGLFPPGWDFYNANDTKYEQRAKR
jgi:hypothetical protein